MSRTDCKVCGASDKHRHSIFECVSRLEVQRDAARMEAGRLKDEVERLRQRLAVACQKPGCTKKHDNETVCRAEGCECQIEEGDSPCPVHGMDDPMSKRVDRRVDDPCAACGWHSGRGAAKKERAAIMAWLRKSDSPALLLFADLIERGEHLR